LEQTDAIESNESTHYQNLHHILNNPPTLM